MTTQPKDLLLEIHTAVRRATVVAVAAGGAVTVAAPGGPVVAHVAVAGDYAPAPDDEVLLAGGDGEWFVIGVLCAASGARRVATASGVEARVEREAGGEVLRVRDAAGRLLLEHRPDGATVISAAAGDLELAAPAGSVRVTARDRVEVRAAAADVKVVDAKLEATTVATVAARARHVLGTLELQAGRIVERAKNAYREAEELSQTRAGRIKLLARQTLHAFADRAAIKAQQDVKIKGEKIYLA